MTVDDPPVLEPVRQTSLVELAYRSIRDSIVAGRMAMGSQLIEVRIAEALGTSRGPVREALRRLEEERLVVERPRHGTFVRRFDGGDLVDIYNLRLAVESSAVRLAVRHEAPTATLRRLIARMAAGAQAGNVGRVVDAEYAFHEELCSASRNEYLLAAYRTLSAQVRMALALDNGGYPDLTIVAGEHEEIVAALDARDEAAAELAIRRHIAAGVAGTIERLGGDPALLLEVV